MSKTARLINFLGWKMRSEDFPSVVNYDITSKCNLRCEHCYWHKTHNFNKEISENTWEQVFLKHKNQGVRSVYLTGGEPTLRINVIRMARKIFKNIGIISNGTIKIPEDVRCRIFVSIDGPKDVHNKIRGAEIFDKVLANIKNDKRVIITPTLTTNNYKYIGEIVKIARDSGVEGVTFSTYTSHLKDSDPLLLQGDSLDFTVKKLLGVYRENKDIVFLTPYIIKLFGSKKHTQNCFFKRKDFMALDANMKIKKPCTLGEGVNCNTCGCIVPVIGYAMAHIDVKSWILFDKIFPERFVIK